LPEEVAAGRLAVMRTGRGYAWFGMGTHDCLRDTLSTGPMRWLLLKVLQLDLPGVLEIRPTRFEDERGFFSQVWSKARWHEAGIITDFVQDNHSFSRKRGVLRGLHYQAPPMAQAKLVRVTSGSVFDVAVDIRAGSPTFGRWTSAILSAERWNQLFIPEGFAHGFLTLEAGCEVVYKVSAAYSADHDRAIRFDDREIAIEWPIAADEMTLSDKDRAAPMLADVCTGFVSP
jgi:dTDP-4-dehydrorhamnose 3,5-epimerase